MNASFLTWKISSVKRKDLVNYDVSTNFKSFLKLQQFSPVSENSGVNNINSHFAFFCHCYQPFAAIILISEWKYIILKNM